MNVELSDPFLSPVFVVSKLDAQAASLPCVTSGRLRERPLEFRLPSSTRPSVGEGFLVSQKVGHAEYGRDPYRVERPEFLGCPPTSSPEIVARQENPHFRQDFLHRR